MDPETPPPNPPPAATGGPTSPPEGQPPPTPPPAAQIVQEGQRTERELALERKLKDRETRLAELEDENRQLKTPPAPPAPPKKKTFADAVDEWLP